MFEICLKLGIATACLFTLFASAEPNQQCAQALQHLHANPNRPYLEQYEINRSLHLRVASENQIEKFRSQTGISRIERDSNGIAFAGTLRVLSDNPHNLISVIGDFNHWGKSMTNEDHLRPVPGTPYFEGHIRALKHGMEYRLLVNGKSLLDPSATQFTTPESVSVAKGNQQEPFLNSIFYDLGRPGAYQMQTLSVDLRGKYVDVAESEVFELVRHWPNTKTGGNGPSRLSDTYRFIAENGVIDELKRMGYNAIEFLPFNSSVDGDAWKYRYQVFGQFGPDSKYGSPDDFKRMVDSFNRNGIAVVMDSVVGHYPYKNGNGGPRDLNPVGLHNWKKADGRSLFGDEMSPWDTYRYDYQNPHIRRFLIDGIITNMRDYGISGIRFDNLDGIRFSKGGDQFLRELMVEIRRVRPETVSIAEMFFGESNVLRAQDKGGMGVDMRTHSNLFDFFKDFMQKRTEEINMEVLKDAIRKPWEWDEIMRILYVTNHDEAANKRDGATGAYVASLLKGDENSWHYVEKKTKAFASLARLIGSASLDMPQMRLLQEGTFYSNPGVDWGLREKTSQRMVRDYFSTLAWAMKDKPAFAPQNLHPNIENHVDAGNKVISLLRMDYQTGKKYYAIINLSHQGYDNYRFGVDASNGGNFKLLVDSDREEFAGSHRLAHATNGYLNAEQKGEHGKPNSLRIPYLAPYGVILFEQQ